VRERKIFVLLCGAFIVYIFLVKIKKLPLFAFIFCCVRKITSDLCFGDLYIVLCVCLEKSLVNILVCKRTYK